MARNVENNLVPFTQYLRPDGRKVDEAIEMDGATCTKAQLIIDAGYRFEAEVLMNGVCSFTIVGYDPRIEEESDVAIKLCPNGPKVPEAVKDLIMDFDLNTFKGS